jgi:hypothetical protein
MRNYYTKQKENATVRLFRIMDMLEDVKTTINTTKDEIISSSRGFTHSILKTLGIQQIQTKQIQTIEKQTIDKQRPLPIVIHFQKETLIFTKEEIEDIIHSLIANKHFTLADSYKLEQCDKSEKLFKLLSS